MAYHRRREAQTPYRTRSFVLTLGIFLLGLSMVGSIIYGFLELSMPLIALVWGLIGLVTAGGGVWGMDRVIRDYHNPNTPVRTGSYPPGPREVMIYLLSPLVVPPIALFWTVIL